MSDNVSESTNSSRIRERISAIIGDLAENNLDLQSLPRPESALSEEPVLDGPANYPRENRREPEGIEDDSTIVGPVKSLVNTALPTPGPVSQPNDTTPSKSTASTSYVDISAVSDEQLLPARPGNEENEPSDWSSTLDRSADERSTPHDGPNKTDLDAVERHSVIGSSSTGDSLGLRVRYLLTKTAYVDQLMQETLSGNIRHDLIRTVTDTTAVTDQLVWTLAETTRPAPADPKRLNQPPAGLNQPSTRPSTMESTHVGSDDALGPQLPEDAYGSRADEPGRHPTGIYGTRFTNMSPLVPIGEYDSTGKVKGRRVVGEESNSLRFVKRRSHEKAPFDTIHPDNVAAKVYETSEPQHPASHSESITLNLSNESTAGTSRSVGRVGSIPCHKTSSSTAAVVFDDSSTSTGQASPDADVSNVNVLDDSHNSSVSSATSSVINRQVDHLLVMLKDPICDVVKQYLRHRTSRSASSRDGTNRKSAPSTSRSQLADVVSCASRADASRADALQADALQADALQVDASKLAASSVPPVAHSTFLPDVTGTTACGQDTQHATQHSPTSQASHSTQVLRVHNKTADRQAQTSITSSPSPPTMSPPTVSPPLTLSRSRNSPTGAAVATAAAVGRQESDTVLQLRQRVAALESLIEEKMGKKNPQRGKKVPQPVGQTLASPAASTANKENQSPLAQKTSAASADRRHRAENQQTSSRKDRPPVAVPRRRAAAPIAFFVPISTSPTPLPSSSKPPTVNANQPPVADPMSLQEAFLLHKHSFVMRSRERLRNIKLTSAERQWTAEAETLLMRNRWRQAKDNDASSSNDGRARRVRSRSSDRRHSCGHAQHRRRGRQPTQSLQRRSRSMGDGRRSRQANQNVPFEVDVVDDESDPVEVARPPMSMKQIRSETRSRYLALPEVKAKKMQEDRQVQAQVNRIRANAFKLKLLERVLQRAAELKSKPSSSSSTAKRRSSTRRRPANDPRFWAQPTLSRRHLRRPDGSFFIAY